MEDWLKEVDSLCDQFARVFVTQLEFEEALHHIVDHTSSPFRAIVYQIVSPPPFGDVTIGTSPGPEPTHLDSINLGGTQCKLEMWRKAPALESPLQFDTARARLTRLVESFWKPEARDKVSSLINLQYGDIKQIVGNSLAREWGKMLCLFFCDLDHFSAVNDALGHDGADRIILQFASILEDAVRPGGVILHRSGDEFIVLYPAEAPDDAILLARTILKRVKDHDFQVDDIKLTSAIGIAVLNRATGMISYEDIEGRAERAVQPGDKQSKRRGTVRFESPGQALPLPKHTEFSRNVALCVIKSGLGSPRPFESPWLNAISRHVCYLVGDRPWPDLELATSLTDLKDWMQPEFSNVAVRSALPPGRSSDLCAVFSPFDLALAVAHGVLRCRFISSKPLEGERRLALRLKQDYSACELTLLPDNLTLMKYGEAGTDAVTMDLGGFVSSALGSWNEDPLVTRRALLIKIGHSDLTLPAIIFAEIIVADDRPTRGGGLPDFWEATIARLIARISANQNISAVYMFGRRQDCAQTVEKLEKVATWNADSEQIAYRTGMSIGNIAAAVERLQGKIFLMDTEEALVSHLASIVLPSYSVRPIAQPTIPQRRFLHRQLRMEGMALDARDGCRVKTIAEAYPVVINIARGALDKGTITDQAGQQLRELVDFKVHLSTPCQDKVPAFYEREKPLLEEYFRREFLSADGLFGQWFKNEGQEDAVVRHVVNAVSNPAFLIATRRAILIVPHRVKPDEELAPLGLVSVRIVPRFLLGRIRLHYSFTWRTVETLVGFPYSVYGSVRFSEYLTEQIRQRLEPGYARQVEMGEVSYLAHSLHIFMDDYGQNIARRIVDDASF